MHKTQLQNLSDLQISTHHYHCLLVRMCVCKAVSASAWWGADAVVPGAASISNPTPAADPRRCRRSHRNSGAGAQDTARGQRTFKPSLPTLAYGRKWNVNQMRRNSNAMLRCFYVYNKISSILSFLQRHLRTLFAKTFILESGYCFLWKWWKHGSRY